MGLVVPDTIEVEMLQSLLNTDLTMRLYSNDVDPDHSDSESSFTEVSGGGYAGKTLTYANWSIAPGEPSQAIYSDTQKWTFTGPPSAPGTIYGYYVTRDSDGKLMWSERFPDANVPFEPVNGSIIQVLPRFTAQSQF